MSRGARGGGGGGGGGGEAMWEPVWGTQKYASQK